MLGHSLCVSPLHTPLFYKSLDKVIRLRPQCQGHLSVGVAGSSLWFSNKSINQNYSRGSQMREPSPVFPTEHVWKMLKNMYYPGGVCVLLPRLGSSFQGPRHKAQGNWGEQQTALDL